MEKIYIYGAGVAGKIFLKNCQKIKSDEVEVIGFIDKNKTGNEDGVKIYSKNEVEKDDIIVIAIRDFNTAVSVFRDLNKEEYHNVWWLENEDLSEAPIWDNLFDTRKWNGGAIYQIEMHIMDSCNLNCRGCAHFSPIFDKGFPAIEARLNDVKKLREKIPYIKRFYILGGEPFLNPQIGDYAIEIAGILRESEIWIVTNGLLIPKADDEELEKIKQSGATVSISQYEPTQKLLPKIEERLKEFNINYEVRPNVSANGFNIPLTTKKDSIHEKLCISNGCLTIWNGNISRCPTLMYIEKFNEVFGQNLPSEGIISLDDSITGWELIERLKEKVPLCDYCVSNPVPWTQCSNNPQLGDFAATD